ncbi:adenosylcobinamide-GDP ribazoletransferase [Alicyclobacillaceae bacterium I2511]|nr:adenosylcobinamide-GDP ribazoletransferase [Alicyclobacillaceae bacterium I2511]
MSDRGVGPNMQHTVALRWIHPKYWGRTFALAVTFLSIIPVPTLADVSQQELRHSVTWYPWVGALLGGVAFVVQGAAGLVLPPLPATGLALGVYTLLTGGLHVDGLMDTADALGSRHNREAALAVMKDSRVGAMGVLVAVLLLGGKWSALAALPTRDLWAFVAVPTVARMALVWSMTLAPSARPQGLGAFYARGIGRKVVGGAAVSTVFLTFLPGLVGKSAGDNVWMCTVALWLLTAGLTLAFTHWMTRRFGGMTGDTYGALNELVEWSGWLLVLACLKLPG